MSQNTPQYNNATALRDKPANSGTLFCFLWLLLFILYLPAAKAGFVTDFTGWLDQVKNHSFWEHINRTNFQARSLYQFTQFNTYILYKLFGIHPWLWHLLFITLHTINATLLFKLVSRLLEDIGVVKGRVIAFTGVLFFCVSPYISEVIVWEPSFHFLQGLLLILVVLLWVQKYVHSGGKKYAWYTAIVYFLSTFSLEVFYITPWLVLTLAIFYRFVPAVDKKVFKEILRYFFVPMLLIFMARFLAYRLIYGDWISRIGTGAVTSVQFQSLGKPAKYLFHLLFLGRFLTNETRQSVYSFCDSTNGILIFYGLVLVMCIFIVARFRSMAGKGKAVSLLFIWMLITLALLIPLWFSDMMLVLFDRYTYFTGAFLYMLLAVLVSFISIQYVRMVLIALFALINLRFAIKVSRYWGKSYKVDNELLHNIPDAGNKTIILLNLPESMNGIPMIGSDKESEFKFMHNLLLPGNKISNTVYDVLSYNMLTLDDGAHATVINDSTVRITLNQWGTWWWFAGKGGYSYENAAFKLNLVDAGHFYELTLRKPSTGYLLLYQTGDQWKAVDMTKKNADQL